MSLSSIKESRKSQTSLPKLRTILASPYKPKYELLEASEIDNFKELLLKIINESGLGPRAFATAHRISIGLGAVLRSINNFGISCVFISLRIKPRFVTDLIAKNAQLRNPAAHIYTLPNLEEFTEQIFGIRALVFTLPLEVSLDPNLREWIKKQRKPMNSTDESKSIFHNKLVAKKCKLGKANLGVEEEITLSNLDKITPVEGRSKLSVTNSSRENTEGKNVNLNINKVKEAVIQKSVPIKYRRIEINKIRPNPNRILKRKA